MDETRSPAAKNLPEDKAHGKAQVKGKAQAKVQAEAEPKGKPVPSERFRKLPDRIRPEDMTATQEAEAAPDPTMGRDPERDFMLRNAGF